MKKLIIYMYMYYFSAKLVKCKIIVTRHKMLKINVEHAEHKAINC